MEIKKGIAVSPGVVVRRAFVLDSEKVRIPRRFFEPECADAEIERFQHGLQKTRDEVTNLGKQVSETIGDQYGAIFETHQRMLEDQKVIGEITDLIREKHFTPEYAVSRTLRKYVRAFRAVEDPYLAERVGDILDIEKRLLRNILGESREELKNLTSEVVLIASDLTTSETAQLDTSKVMGFATDLGGRTSHTAIVARAFGIPAVVGLENVTEDVSGGDTVIIDGNRGLVIIAPDEETLAKFKKLEEGFRSFSLKLHELRDVPAVTTDGVEISLNSNIEFPREIPIALKNGAQGIGLYRTEFLYLSSGKEPTEEEHFEAYRESLELLGPRPLVIRTFDIGADKIADGHPPERNPFLGARSLRLCFEQLGLFKTQLRAILRASALGDVRILFPMVSSVEELRHAREILTSVQDELRKQGIPFKENIPVGIMAELPSTALTASMYTNNCDFFSIGTNDLIQYTIGVDRVNERVAQLFTPAHPAVLRLIKCVIEAGRKSNTPVAMCGEMAGEVEYVMLLVGLGLRNLSVSPTVIPELKKAICSFSCKEAEKLARSVWRFDQASEIVKHLRERATAIMPEIY